MRHILQTHITITIIVIYTITTVIKINRGEGHMMEVMKAKLKEYLDQMDDTDSVFMKQILTLARLHIEKKKKNTGEQ